MSDASSSLPREADCIIAPELPQEGVVRVISDLHLGHERSEVPSIDSLRPLLRGIRMLIVAGDLAETRRCPWQQQALGLRAAFRDLCAEAGVTLLELAGNHDPDVRPLLASLWGGRVVVMHGHALFKEVAPWSWEYLRNREACDKLIAQYPNCEHDLIERLELSRAVSLGTTPIMRRDGIRNRYLRGFMHCFWPPSRPWNILRGWLTCGRRARDFAERFLPGCETLIIGHFHRSGHWRYPGLDVYSTGACFKHAQPFCADLAGGRLLRYAPWPRK